MSDATADGRGDEQRRPSPVGRGWLRSLVPFARRCGTSVDWSLVWARRRPEVAADKTSEADRSEPEPVVTGDQDTEGTDAVGWPA